MHIRKLHQCSSQSSNSDCRNNEAGRGTVCEILNSQIEFADNTYDAAQAPTLLSLTEMKRNLHITEWLRLHSQVKYPIIIEGGI